MHTENIILLLIGVCFAGFLAGLIGKNTNNARKKSFKRENLYKYLMAVSVIAMLGLALIYNIFFL